MRNDDWLTTQFGAGEAAVAGAAEPRSPLLDAKVMMVDDEPLMTELIQAHLEDAGYANFVVTNDPRDAMPMVRRERPGVVLLDLMMPQVSGFDILEALRADDELRYTPVIVLTASTGAPSKLRALQLGATDFLAKPVDASELVLRLRNTLAFQQYHERQRDFDAATGLPNERRFERFVDELLQRPGDAAQALFSITVPELRRLRESVDRDTAEALAVVVARRLESLAGTRPRGAAGERWARVARLGTQHFAVVADVVDTVAVEAAAKVLLDALARPVQLGRHEVTPTPWVGVALSPGDGTTAAALRQSADLAASHARSAGERYSFASPELNARSYQRLLLGNQLRGAAQRGELRLHYQPKVDFASGRVAGVEALVRWQHPEHGLLPPGRFIALAEELELMGTLGRWVIEQACRDAAQWARDGLGEIKVAVNVSRPQFSAGDLCAVVRQAMFDSGLPARQLVVELTESMLVDDVHQAIALMHELKALGVTLSIDDFGTGYSSLAYLKKFPLDELKIDRSFVVDLPGLPADMALARTIVDLGHSLGMSVTAEGVETDGQRDCLQSLGCDTYQGYLFSKPLPPPALIDLLRAPAGR